MIRKDDISMEHNYYLAHHGVKGQKWGFRKQRELSGARPVKSKKSKSGIKSPKTLKKNVRKNIALAFGFDGGMCSVYLCEIWNNTGKLPEITSGR